MYIFEIIAERKIREAIDSGELDNLPGKGKPLANDNLDNVPGELRCAYKILKNAGFVPEEIELKKSIYCLNDLLNTCHDEEERKTIRQKLNQKQMRYSMIMEARGCTSMNLLYQDKIMEKLDK